MVDKIVNIPLAKEIARDAIPDGLTNGKSYDGHWHGELPISTGVEETSNTHNIADTDYVVIINASAGGIFNVNIPLATGSGRTLKIKNVSTTGVSLEIVCNSIPPSTIDGETSIILYPNEGICIIDYTVGKWAIIDRGLSTLSGIAKTAFNWNNQNLNNVKQINLTDPTELTIATGVITKTQGFHTVDTEGDASSDDLVTINGGTVGDILFLTAASATREVKLLRSGNIKFQPDHMIEGMSFVSPAGASGTFYTGGFYTAPAADANLTQASPTVTIGSANTPHASHVFIVAAGAGTTDAGTVSIVVSGTSINGAGTRTTSDSEVLVANVTTMATNSYYETTKRWLGVVTFTLTGAGGATTFAADFNYGKAVYDSFDERHSTIKKLEIFGRAGANDTGFDIQLLHHKKTGWTYHASAFVPGTTPICSLVTDYSTDNDLVTNERFHYDREVVQAIDPDAGEGFLLRVITTANKAVEFMNCSVYAEVIPNDHHLQYTGQGVALLFDGANWMVL